MSLSTCLKMSRGINPFPFSSYSFEHYWLLTSYWCSLATYCSHWSRHVTEGAALEAGWNTKFAEYEKKYPEEAAELKSITTGELPAGWEKALPVSGHFHLSLSYFKLSSTAFGLGYPHIKFLALGCGF